MVDVLVNLVLLLGRLLQHVLDVDEPGDELLRQLCADLLPSSRLGVALADEGIQGAALGHQDEVDVDGVILLAELELAGLDAAAIADVVLVVVVDETEMLTPGL